MNKYDNFFNNLFPLQPFMPYVQCVLPTVFDDSLSYLETLGKVVKALNDTTSNVNTLEQAVKAFAEDLAQYDNLSITPVEITYNSDTGSYTASMTYNDIVSALSEGHTVIMHVSGAASDSAIEFYSASLKLATVEGVKLLYWDSPVYTVDDKPVIYRAYINENGASGVMREVLGSDVFIIHYDSNTETADKTFAEIAAAIEAEKTVALIADHFFISNARWTTDGNDIISAQFNAFNITSAQGGVSLACITYAVDNSDTWTATVNNFPNETRVNSMIDAKLSAAAMIHAVQYVEQELGDYKKAVARKNIAAGHFNIGIDDDETSITIVDLVTNTPRIYAINKGPYRIPVTLSNGVYSTYATGKDILLNVHNCYAQVGNVVYYPVAALLSAAYGTVYLAAIDPHTQGILDTDILEFTLNGSDTVVTIAHYTNDIKTGETQKIQIAASTQSISLFPNKLCVITGDATTLNIMPTPPSDNNIANEYHFIFNSGATPTVLNLPSTVRKPEGFKIEANHVYEVSILEDNMTMQGWAVTV